IRDACGVRAKQSLYPGAVLLFLTPFRRRPIDLVSAVIGFGFLSPSTSSALLPRHSSESSCLKCARDGSWPLRCWPGTGPRRADPLYGSTHCVSQPFANPHSANRRLLRFAYDKSTFSVCRAAWLNSSTIPSRSNKTSGPSLNFVMKALLASSSKGFRLFLFCRGRRALPCDDLIGNLVVSCLRNNVLPDKIILPAVGPVVDDLLGVGIADAGKRHQFLLARRVDVD